VPKKILVVYPNPQYPARGIQQFSRKNRNKFLTIFFNKIEILIVLCTGNLETVLNLATFLKFINVEYIVSEPQLDAVQGAPHD
jgi:hypothetical protein